MHIGRYVSIAPPMWSTTISLGAARNEMHTSTILPPLTPLRQASDDLRAPEVTKRKKVPLLSRAFVYAH